MTRGWYPGHMLVTQRVIRDLAPYLSGFLEVVDARAPLATRHAPLREWVGRTPRILVLNKADLADPATTRRLEAFFAAGGESGVPAAVAVSAREGESARRRVQATVTAVLKPPYRLAVVGMPNLGKSTLLNRMVGRRRTAVGARPGVTRGPQWIRLPGGWEWLDLPGVVTPARTRDWRLGALGVVPVPPGEAEAVVTALWPYLGATPGAAGDGQPEEEAAWRRWGRARGYLTSGARLDETRTLTAVLTAFQRGDFGRISLETPPPEGGDGHA